jgi:hypothetical protein
MLEDELRQDLAEQIRQAFADTPKPRKNRLGRTQDPPKSLVNKEWQDVTVDEVNSYSLSLFRREGCRYYTPAYLMAVTLHPDEVNQPLTIIEALSPPPKTSWDDQSFTIGAEFDLEQARVIGEFFELFDLLYREKLNPTKRNEHYGKLLRDGKYYWWYQQTRELRAEVIDTIEAAFASVRRPDGKLGDEFETGDFVGKDWKEIEPYALNSALAFFSGDAFKYYLPAYLIGILRYPVQSDLASSYVLRELAPPERDAWRFHSLGEEETFNNKQKAAICTFFMNYEKLTPFGWTQFSFDDTAERTIEYWRHYC